MSDHVSVEKFKRAKAAITRLPSDEHMAFRGVPMTEFTKEQILRVLLWQIERSERACDDHYKASKVFRHWPLA